MKVIIQVVDSASVEIDRVIHNEIDKGYLMYVSFKQTDTLSNVSAMCEKISKLRICPDQNGKINLTGLNTNRQVLSISQFTLYADLNSGNRPSFTNAKLPREANVLYEVFNQRLSELGFELKSGVFGADMKITSVNDGPLTFIVEN